MGRERLEAFIKRNNSYISKTFWQKFAFVCISPSVFPKTFLVLFSIYTQTIESKLLEFKYLKLQPNHVMTQAHLQKAGTLSSSLKLYIFVSYLVVKS